MAPAVMAYSNLDCGGATEPPGGFRLELGVKMLTLDGAKADLTALGGVSKRLWLFDNGMSVHSATFYQKGTEEQGAQEEIILLWPNKVLGIIRPFGMLGGDVIEFTDVPTLMAQGLVGFGGVFQVSGETVLWIGWKTGIGSDRTDQFGLGLSTAL